jgi:hypothetical protein
MLKLVLANAAVAVVPKNCFLVRTGPIRTLKVSFCCWKPAPCEKTETPPSNFLSITRRRSRPPDWPLQLRSVEAAGFDWLGFHTASFFLL